MQFTPSGAATALIAVPGRYMHSPCEVISLKDLDAGSTLLAQLLAAMPAKRSLRHSRLRLGSGRALGQKSGFRSASSCF